MSLTESTHYLKYASFTTRIFLRQWDTFL